MKLYTLKFMHVDCALDEADHISFEAPDMIRALLVAHERASPRSAELWDDARKLCTIRRGDDPGHSLRTQQA